MTENGLERIECKEDSYRGVPDTFDEMHGHDHSIRDHWKPLISAMESLGDNTLQQFQTQAERLIGQNGVTYQVHGDANRENRPWKLDLIPAIISENDWKTIDAGLTQRADLLNLILTDLYGSRALIRSGTIPPELVYSAGGFLLPCDKTYSKGNKPLRIYASDIVRGPDTQWWVISDRTQAPVGVGYALENRTVLSRIMPSLLNRSNVQRLSSFFRLLRTTFESISPRKIMNPRIVVLTNGPCDESYFEHAYLTNYLGYTLVKSDDLTVRDNIVWLKSIDGLKQVDIIFRRVADRLCDPLELSPDSISGVPGLLEAVRQGNVSVVNSIGSSVIENPGLMAFLPALCREVLGQDLRLPSAGTWWCGQKTELQYVLDHVERLVIRTTYWQPGSSAIIGMNLSRKDIKRLKDEIRSRPYLYVGQEMINNSTVPSLIDGKLEPRRAVLRCFLLGTDGGFRTMPGGLTLCAPSRESVIADYELGGRTKDTWILASEPDDHVTLWRSEDEPVESESVLTSHSAECLFLTGRHIERAEGLARMFRRVINDYQELDWVKSTAEIGHIRTMLGALVDLNGGDDDDGLLVRDFQLEKTRRKFESQLTQLAYDRRKSGNLASTICQLNTAARAVRERWSSDSWRVLQTIEDHWGSAFSGHHPTLTEMPPELDTLINDLTAFTGFNAESMTRELGWVMLDIGRRFERSRLLIKILQRSMVPLMDDVAEFMTGESILSALECLITYRRRYRAHIRLGPVLELLLMDESNPRSLLFQLDRLTEHLAKLPHKHMSQRLSVEEKLILECSTRLRVVVSDHLIEPDNESKCHINLGKLLRRSEKNLDQAADLVMARYFRHVNHPQQLVPLEQEI